MKTKMKDKTVTLLIVYITLICLTIFTANLLSSSLIINREINSQFLDILFANILICLSTIPIRLQLRKNEFLFCRIILIVVAALLLGGFVWSYYNNWIRYIYHECFLGGKAPTITEMWSFVILDIEYVSLLFSTIACIRKQARGDNYSTEAIN